MHPLNHKPSIVRGRFARWRCLLGVGDSVSPWPRASMTTVAVVLWSGWYFRDQKAHEGAESRVIVAISPYKAK